MRYIIVSDKRWHERLFEQLQISVKAEWLRIDSKENFTLKNLKEFNPDKIFIPHWSHIISPEIYNAFECIVFHMTDLPYGRGGSPLQNLIERGHSETMISAIRVARGIDTGAVYLKRKLTLDGSALEIFLRSSTVIKAMIEDIIFTPVLPVEQTGDAVVFKRRVPAESNMAELKDLEKVYDHIRMLDCEGYPAAFIENEFFRFEFSRVSFKDSETLLADVRIIRK